MKLFKLLYYFYYRKRYGIPCMDEIDDALDELVFQAKYIGDKVEKYAIQYSMGFPLSEIAEMNNVTRERVRQSLWKLWRTAKK